MSKVPRNGNGGKKSRQGSAQSGVSGVLGSRGNKQLKLSKKGDFASGYEFRVWSDAKRRGLRIEYEPTTFDYERRIKGGRCADCGSGVVVKRARYTPDFRIGGKLLVETKGKFDASTRQRMDDFVRSRPDVQVHFLFGSDNWTTRKHLQRYTEWCGERGIRAAVGDRIPEGWINEPN
jgi:hypothetical protein